MSKRDDHLLLADIQESIEKVVRYTAGMDFDAFWADEKTKDAVVRNLEIIGEAANSLSPNYIASRSQVPWRK